jgi:ankyrin repeat protein
MSSIGKKNGFRSLLGTVLIFLVFFAGAPNEAPVADAAQNNDVLTVRELLRQGADPNAAQPDGLTALHWSSLNNEIEMIEVLLFAGANPGPTSRLGGYTPLHMASRAGHSDVVEKLLVAGADPNRYTATGVTAMHFAAESNSAELINILAGGGGDVNSLDTYSNRTPLMFASTRNAPDAVQALIDLGADMSIANNVKDYEEISKNATEIRNRRRRIREAAEDPQPEDDQEDSRGGPPGSGNRSSNPAGYLSTEKVETPKGPEVLSSIQQIGKQGGFTALHFAARDGNIESARLLIKGGADVNKTTIGDQSSPLLVAVINGNYDLAKELLEADADPNILSDDGAGPLFATLNIEWSLRTWYPQPQAFRQQKTDYLELMEDLLLAGADPDQRVSTHIWYAAYNAGRMGVDFSGATPFWRASYAHDVEAMKLLVKHGADPNIWTYNIVDPRRRFFLGNNQPEDEEDPSGLPPVEHGDLGVHPLHAATGVGFGSSRVAQQHRGVPDGWLPAAKYLIEELGVDPNLRDKDGYSALHHSAARGDNETILYLVSQGADVKVISRRGQTTADLANSPEQRAQPHPITIALLEKLGSKNNHNCRSCGG